MTIIMNPPYGKGCPQKKIFNKACEKGKVYSLQPVGSWRTRVGNICELLPLHTSKEEFDIAIMPLAIHTNANDNVVEWNADVVPTCADLPNGNESLKMSAVNTGRGKAMNIPVNVRQPLNVSTVKNGENNIHFPVTLKQPLGVGTSNKGPMLTNGVHIKQQEDRGNVIYFNTKKERTNFIKNIGNIIPLQMLFFSGLFPRPKQRLLPPLDREYTLDELLEYFNFPKDAYDEFNDMTQEEEYRVSYERWKTVRKEKYGLDWEEE